RKAGTFTTCHETFWQTAKRKLGDGAGTRALIGVLLLHRNHPADAVAAGMRAALKVGSVDADVVAVETRRAAGTSRNPRAEATGGEGSVTPLPDRAGPPAPLPADDRPMPDVARYDRLLTRNATESSRQEAI